MAHEITQRADGKAEMAWIGETPWHGLGQQLQEGASVDEFLVAAGMDWVINRSPVQYTAGRGINATSQVVDGQNVLWRSDTRSPLGIVSADYNIVQPYEVLEFFRDISDAGGAQLHTAGTLFGGKRFWALAKIGEEHIAKGDKLGNFLLLSTSADGSLATSAMQTTVRVVCNNTLRAAVEGDPLSAIKISHRQRFDAARLQKQMAGASETFAQMCENINELTKIKISQAGAQAFIQQILRADAPAADEAQPQADTLAALLSKHPDYVSSADAEPVRIARAHPGEDIILQLFNGAGHGSALSGSAGTAWGLVNAVTEYVDHFATAKSTDHRLARAWYGAGDELKSEAFATALTLG
jgi:phage/plasmid-like protein (TIGR03299 family)